MLKLAAKRLAARRNRTYRSAALSRAHDQAEADRLLKEGLAAAGLEESALSLLPGSDVRKVALADLLLTRTLARQSWIADRLVMRSAANVSQQVRRYRLKKKPKLPSQLKAYLHAVKIC
jgi:putative transposase